MAIDNSPRSVADATRFTSSTPHAQTKPTTSPSSTTTTAPKPTLKTFSRPLPATSRTGPAVSSPTAGAPRGPGGSLSAETLEERVRRLRAAHLAAKNHSVSRMDQIINFSRGFFDQAHRVFVMGLIGLSGVALVVTVYATVDMAVYNRKRRSEFFEMQQKLAADSLEAARLAYMTGKATEQQIALVEDAEARAKQAGGSLPPLLGRPQAPTGAAAITGWTPPTRAGEEVWSTENNQSGEDGAPKKKGGIRGWFFGGLKTEDTAAASRADSSGPNPGWGTTTAAAMSEQAGGLAQSVGQAKDSLKEQARAAFETEKESQRNGGVLDQVGLEGSEPKKATKTAGGWW